MHTKNVVNFLKSCKQKYYIKTIEKIIPLLDVDSLEIRGEVFGTILASNKKTTDVLIKNIKNK